MMRKPPAHTTYCQLNRLVYNMTLDGRQIITPVCASGLLRALKRYVNIKGKPKKIWLLWYEKPRKDTVSVWLDGLYITVIWDAVIHNYYTSDIGFRFEDSSRFGSYHVEVWYE